MGFDRTAHSTISKRRPAIAGVLGRSTGAPIAVLTSSIWNSAPPQANNLIGRVATWASLRVRSARAFRMPALAQRHGPDIEYLERKRAGALGFLAFLDGRYRSICRRWKDYRLATYSLSLLDQAKEMAPSGRTPAATRLADRLEAEARLLFGDHWKGEQSDCAFLQRYVDWVVEFRSIWLKHALSNRTVRLASEGRQEMSIVDRALQAACRATRGLEALEQAVGWSPGGHLERTETIDEATERTKTLLDRVEAGPPWASFEAARQTVGGGPGCGAPAPCSQVSCPSPTCPPLSDVPFSVPALRKSSRNGPRWRDLQR